MTAYPPSLVEHLQRTVTTVCHCWRLTRRDGTVLGFTDHDRALVVSGTTFRPRSGLAASEARSTLGLTVDTVDVEGALSSADISEADIAAGRYDGATVETFLVNWRAPADAAPIRKATVGRITRRDGSFVAELESSVHALDKQRGRYVRRSCDAELGDARCGVNLALPAYRGTGAVTSIAAPATLTTSGLGGFAPGWFTGGVLTWTSGANAANSVRVLDHAVRDGQAVLSLWPDAGAAVETGDAFEVTAGCDKSFATCKARFANAANFRGFPHLPGNDVAYGYVTEGQVFDGGPIVP